MQARGEREVFGCRENENIETSEVFFFFLIGRAGLN